MRLEICLIVCCFGIHLANSIAIRNGNNVDCNPDDLEKMSIENQIKDALKSDHCRELAHAAFKKKWESPIISISETKSGIYETLFGNITVISSDLAENFLNVFGSKYDSLWVDCDKMEWNTCKKIGGYLHKYCAESLETLLFIYLKPGVFKNSEPFKNLHSLTIVGGHCEIDPTIVFPNLSQLKIQDYYDEGNFDRVYPHLIEFWADRFIGGYRRFFKKNPQIRKLGSLEGSIDFIVAVRDSYPQLEEFSFRLPYKFNETYQGPPFVFEYVKRVKIFSDSEHSSIGEKIVFKPLEHLEIYSGHGKVNDGWFTFIESNNNLNQITTYTLMDGPSAYFDGPGVLRLSKAANFIKVDISCDKTVGAEEILTFVKNSHNLCEFNVYFIEENENLETIFDQVRKELENEWKSIRTIPHIKYQSISIAK